MWSSQLRMIKVNNSKVLGDYGFVADATKKAPKPLVVLKIKIPFCFLTRRDFLLTIANSVIFSSQNVLCEFFHHYGLHKTSNRLTVQACHYKCRPKPLWRSLL